MAFTATIANIQRGDGAIRVSVIYNDSATGFTVNRDFFYADDGSVTQAAVVADITTIGQQYKSTLTLQNNLQSKIGTVITI